LAPSFGGASLSRTLGPLERSCRVQRTFPSSPFWCNSSLVSFRRRPSSTIYPSTFFFFLRDSFFSLRCAFFPGSPPRKLRTSGTGQNPFIPISPFFPPRCCCFRFLSSSFLSVSSFGKLMRPPRGGCRPFLSFFFRGY